MKLTNFESARVWKRLIGCGIALIAWLATWFAMGIAAPAQGVTTTTVQGTVYLANGQPGAGTLVVSWPAFTTAAGQAIAADSLTVTIPSDGFVSVNLAPNQGATPAGEFYTAVYDMSDGSTSTEYWVVPAAAQATIAQVRTQVMPAAQAVQTVSKAYVDQSISELTQSLLTASGGNLSGPLFLNGDPTQPLQAADKEYVDAAAANPWPAQVVRVDELAGADFGAKLQACVNAVSASYGGTCDARNFTGNQSMGSSVTISTSNTTVLLPCATIATANQIVVTAGTRNVSLRGCALRGGSAASGSEGGTALAYSGASAMIQVGDPTYAVDTPGFALDNVAISTTGSTSASAQGLVAYRTQELNIESVYLLGNPNQTAMTLDGTGNYTGGTFLDDEISGFQTAVNAIGHQAANSATTDWVNASTFVRLHIDCPLSNGKPIAGTYGINLQQGDGNTFTGGDVEGCATALHLGPNAQNNTIVGLRNENSTNQVIADAGSSYNNWISGGTMFTGQLIDNGTRNSFFLDSFHRSFNALNGDWYGSQQDATVTDHQRLGIGLGNERGRETEYQTDYGYRWETGLGDGTSSEQFYNVTDLLNNVQRLSVGQYLSATPNVVTKVVVNNGGCYSSSAAPTVAFTGGGGSGAAATANLVTTASPSCAGGYTVGSVTVTSGGSGYTSQPTLSFTGSNQTTAPNAVAEIATTGSTNNQTVINSAGTGAVVLNGSNNAGTGGVVIGSGGVNETTVATVDKAGDAQFNGTLQVNGTSQSAGTMTVRNNADAEADYYLWPGLTTSQKGSFTYKDWNGNSEWYLLKDASNNWALNSAVGGLDSFKAYQSTNSGDTYVNASNSSGVVRVNYETGSGTGFKVYSGNSGTVYASFTGANATAFPGLAASSGKNCLQIDDSGYVTNTGSACGSGSDPSGTASSSNSGYIAYYSGNGSSISGMSTVPVTAGGTGASTAAQALASLGGLALTGGTLTGALNGTSASFSGAVAAATSVQAPIVETSAPPVLDLRSAAFAGGAVCNGTTTSSIDAAFQAALNALPNFGGIIRIVSPSYASYCYFADPEAITWPSFGGGVTIEIQGMLEVGSTFTWPSARTVSIVGIGGCINTQFQTQNNACIYPNWTPGQTTLGTAVTAAYNSPSTVTVTPGSMNGIYVGTVLGVRNTDSCTINTLTQAASGEQVTATFTGSCPIAPGGYVTVSGSSVSGYNGTWVSISNDRVTGILVFNDTTTGLGPATGGTMTGPDDDNVEDVQVTAVTSTTFTAEFFRTHPANATIGIITLANMNTTSSSVIKNINVSTGAGPAVINIGYREVIDNLGSLQKSTCLSNTAMPFPALVAQGNFVTMNNSAIADCNAPESIHAYSNGDEPGVEACGPNCYSSGPWHISNSFIGPGGIKVEYSAGEFSFTDDVFEQAGRGAVIYDPTSYILGNPQTFRFVFSGPQDNVTGAPTAELYQMYPGATGNSLADVQISYPFGVSVNDYFNGRLSTYSPDQSSELTPQGPMGAAQNGAILDAELRGEGAGFGPQVVPYATEPVPTNPASWPTGTGGIACTVNTGKLGPDGAYNAAQLTYSGTTVGASKIYTWSGTPAVGDVILVGLDTYTPGFYQDISSQGGAMQIAVANSAVQFNSIVNTSGLYSALQQYELSISGDWYHRIVDEYVVTSAPGTATTISFNLGCSPTHQPYDANPFFIYVPASAGIPISELNRWRQQLLHGSVPPNWNNPGMPVTMDPISAGGYYVNSNGANNHQFGTGDLADWTNTGIANGDVPVWNSTAQKWMPGPQSAASPTLSSIGTDANSVLGSGGSYAAPTCATGWTCDALSGMVTFTTGASPGKSGSLFVLNLSAPRASDVACTFQPAMTYGGTAPLGFGIYEEAGTYAGTNKTSAYVYNATLTPHTQYFVSYTCGR